MIPPAHGRSLTHLQTYAAYGDDLEWLIGHSERESLGAFFTPLDVADRIARLALRPQFDRCGDDIEAVKALRVFDPSCGTGNMLLVAGDRIAIRLAALGMDPDEARMHAFTECVAGTDISPLIAETCRRVLSAAAGITDYGDPDAPQVAVRVLDVLTAFALHGIGVAHFARTCTLVGAGDDDLFDVVIGNPPFRTQYRTSMSRAGRLDDALAEALGVSGIARADDSAVFLMIARRLAKREGGTIAMIQPLATISGASTRPYRRDLLKEFRTDPYAAWVCSEESIFNDTPTKVWVPFLSNSTVDFPRKRIPVFTGRLFASTYENPDGSVRPRLLLTDTLHEKSWSSILAMALGVPIVDIDSPDTLGTLASPVVPYLDRFYSLKNSGAVVDRPEPFAPDGPQPKLLVAGAIDPAVSLWGSKVTRFNKADYVWPRVILDALDAKARAFYDRTNARKILVASSTKVFEVVVDLTGEYVPGVPVASVLFDDTCPDELIWRVAAMLSSPPVTAWALWRSCGRGLNGGTLVPNAEMLREVPLPSDEAQWETAGIHFEDAAMSTTAEHRAVALKRSANFMLRAYGIPCESPPTGLTVDSQDTLFSWWLSRLKIAIT